MIGHRILAWMLLSCWVAPAAAAGGAHVIDDSEVETPGLCHFENWATGGSGRSRLINVSPACTFLRLPRVEIGGFVNRGLGAGPDVTLIGLAPKVTLRPEARGLGIGVASNVGLDARTGKVSTAAIIAPVTLPFGDGVRLNANGGWIWTRGIGNEAFTGAQLEIPVRSNLGFMIECFDRSAGRAGAQTGMRWTMDEGRMDIDVLASRYGDGQTRNAVTLGVTLRR